MSISMTPYNLSPEGQPDLAQIVQAAVREVLQERKGESEFCNICMLNSEKHREEHEAMHRVIAFFDRLEEVRWGILRKVLYVAVLAGISALVYGIKDLLGGS